MRTPEEIIVDNGVIAQYFDAKYQKDDYEEYGYWFQKPFFGEWHFGYSPEALKFHKSWDWIIPVIQKIKIQVNLDDVFEETLWHNICLAVQSFDLYMVNMTVLRYIEYQSVTEEE